MIHVKEDLGQHTRDACSQILNAAKMLRAALLSHQPKNFLQMLWDEGIGKTKREGWRGLVQNQLKTLKWDSFLRIFFAQRVFMATLC